MREHGRWENMYAERTCMLQVIRTERGNVLGMLTNHMCGWYLTITTISLSFIFYKSAFKLVWWHRPDASAHAYCFWGHSKGQMYFMQSTN